MRLRRLGPPISALVLATVPSGPAMAASHEGSLFDGKKDASARVYERNEYALERFWDDVDEILGSRVGHESEDNHDITAVVIEVGAVALTEDERRRLEAAAPQFVDLNVFRTKYSIDDLQEIGERAESALGGAGTHSPSGGFGYLDVPDRITVHLLREAPWAHEILRRQLPDDAFRVEVSGAIEILPLIPQPPDVLQRWTAALAALVSAGALLGLKRLRRTPATPNPAH